MDPATITLAFTALDLLVKEIPAIIGLVQEIKSAVSNSPQTAEMLATIAKGTRDVDAATLVALQALLASCKQQ